MTKTIVLINGEKQVGKSTFAQHLWLLLFENNVTAESYSFVYPIEHALRSLMTVTHGDGAMQEIPYNELKNMPVVPGLPFTGRDWMIMNGDAMRAMHPYALQVIFMNQVLANPSVDVWIIENWGFDSELDFFKEPGAVAALGDFKLVTVNLSARATRKYGCGEQYDNDNRFNLDCRAEFIDPPVNKLAEHIDPQGTYLVDTIALQFSAVTGFEPDPSEAVDTEEAEA